MSTGIFVVLMLIVAGGWWIPLVIWSRRQAKHWHRYDGEHEAALLEEKLREHDRRKARWAAAVMRWGSEEAAYRFVGDPYEDCPCPSCVSIWLMTEFDRRAPGGRSSISDHMVKHLFALLVGVGLALGGMVGTAGADCAWVLYWAAELPSGLSGPQQALSAYDTKVECERAAVGNASNIHRNWTGGFSVYSLDGEKITATMKCLPDTVKP